MRRLILLSAIGTLVGCAVVTPSQDSPSEFHSMASAEAASALREYLARLRKRDVQGVASLFTVEGVIEREGEERIIGRAAIANQLRMRAASNIDMEVSSTVVSTVGVDQRGKFTQRVRTSEGREVLAEGQFLVRWQKQPQGEWLIDLLRISTVSPNGA